MIIQNWATEDERRSPGQGQDPGGLRYSGAINSSVEGDLPAHGHAVGDHGDGAGDDDLVAGLGLS